MKKVLSLLALFSMFAFAGCAKKKQADKPTMKEKHHMKKDHYAKKEKSGMKKKECKPCKKAAQKKAKKK